MMTECFPAGVQDLLDAFDELAQLLPEQVEIVSPPTWRLRDADRRGPAMRRGALTDRHTLRLDRALPQHRPNYRQRRRSAHYRMQGVEG